MKMQRGESGFGARGWRRASLPRPLSALLFPFVLLLAGCEAIEIDLSSDSSSATSVLAPLAPARPSPLAQLPVDLPPAMRMWNYGGGSCMHAAWEDVLKWQHQERAAAYWRASHGGPASVKNIAQIADGVGLDYAYTDSGSVAFLEWCSRTRRGAAIHWMGGRHAIVFCGFVGGDALVLGTNEPDVTRMPRDQFLNEWLKAGGCAITPVYSPTPPKPWT